MRQIFLASEESHKGPALLGDMIPNGPSKHRVAGLEGIENGTLCHRRRDIQLHVAADSRYGSQMSRQHHGNHARVWTSTESTAGRSRTMGAQLSPASADAYTWPPVVPKYTPQESSESIAMASRSTLT